MKTRLCSICGEPIAAWERQNRDDNAHDECSRIQDAEALKETLIYYGTDPVAAEFQAKRFTHMGVDLEEEFQ